MKKHLIAALCLCAALSGAHSQDYKVKVAETDEKMEQGNYRPSWESLANHETPEWFRDAKFGIWAHWGPQCVEASGDWMARKMYLEGSYQYKYHVEHYGHPSEFGFKDILPLFKAEHWSPDSLVAYYKAIGAKYFFALGNHHDNYDLWDSKYQPWNSMNIGPKRDVLGEWAAAARKAGLPFGISLHADHAWTWYEPARRYDRSGEKMGVPYDGWMTKADGVGKWWEGYDPQDLYAQEHTPSKATWADGMIHQQWAWGNGASLPSQKFVTNFYNRTLDAINRYDPDLLYFDATVMPFYPISDAGLKIAAHFYNHNEKKNKGKATAVMFGKILDEQQRKAITWDVERGAPSKMIEQPWQTCTCLGDWHYNTRTYEKGYKSAALVVRQLVDVVSKNGNLLLSVPLRADGTFDEKEKAILDEIGRWLKTNGESVYGTRPWLVFGEGPIAEKGIALNAQGFNDSQYRDMDSREIRFTQTRRYVYATSMAWPKDGKLTITSLASGNKHIGKTIKSVYLLGYGKLKAVQDDEGLHITLPKTANNIAPVVRIIK